MIAYIQGKILRKSESYLVVETGGVGYKVALPSSTILSKRNDEEVRLHVHTHVREDQISLYGFETVEELGLFELLVSVSGVGPKLALSILSAVSVEHIRSAILTSDIAVFTKVAGIGRKTAERLIVELREKISEQGHEVDSSNLSDLTESLQALEALGYRRQEVKEALKKLPSNVATTQQIVKEALKYLSGQKSSR